MGKKKVKRVARSIVVGHLEKVSSRIFDDYRKQIYAIIKDNYGVYALYRGARLYYVGLATDFKCRINQHLKDRHKGKWNKFSLYLIRKTDHLREIEALLLRIADPSGNKFKGKLKRSKNLRPALKELLTEDTKLLIEELLGLGGAKKAKKKKKVTKAKTRNSKADRPLKGLFKTGKVIYATYKGKDYKAYVNRIGRLRYKGKWYDSPSAVGSVIRGGKSTNGWRFWKYKDKSGHLVFLSTLRK